jgi:hypothetical protein
LEGASARLRNAKEAKGTRKQKCEPGVSKGESPHAQLSAQRRHTRRIPDQSFDCHVAALLAPWRLGRPPLWGVDSILGRVWPGTGLREKGKASLGLIQPLQSLPLPVVAASALRNVGDRRTKLRKIETLRLPRFFSQRLPLRIFACALLHSPSANSAPIHQLPSPFGCVQNQLQLVVLRCCNEQKDLFDFVSGHSSESLALVAKSSSLAFKFIAMADLQQPQDVVPQQQGQVPLVGQSNAPLTNSAGENLQCQWQGCGERCSTPETLYVSVHSPAAKTRARPDRSTRNMSASAMSAANLPTTST